MTHSIPRRTLAALLAAMMLLALPGAPALAADGDTAENEPAVTDETEATPVPEDTAAPIPEAAESPAPESTATPAPEDTAVPVPEPTAEPVPEVTAEPTSEVTAAPDGAEPASIGADVPMPISQGDIDRVQNMINRLPDEVTWENYEDVSALLDEIFRALNALGPGERTQVGNIDKYERIKTAINSLGDPSFSGGNGTADAPYLIQTKGDLKSFRSYVNAGRGGDKCYRLGENIDLDGEAWTPIGKSMTYAFSGTFDGGGHTISGIGGIEYAGNYVGLFGCNFGTVKDLTVKGVMETSGPCIGGIVSENHGTIENCTSAVSVTSTNSGAGRATYAGGIAGLNSSGTIQNCSNTGEAAGGRYVGGIAGENLNGTIQNCSNAGEVTRGLTAGGIAGQNVGTIQSCSNGGAVTSSGEEAGGIAGQSVGTIQNCYNTGPVTSSGESAGGIEGENLNGTIRNCYDTGEAIGSKYSGGITGLYIKWTGENCYYLDTIRFWGALGEAKTADEFASGQVAWLLQNGQETQVWGQQLPGDSYPVLTGDTSNRVHKVTFQTDEAPVYAVEYVNTGQTVTLPGDPPKNDGDTFYGWSTAQGADGVQFDPLQPITEDKIIYAVDWENFTADSGQIEFASVHGIGKTEDLSKHIHYASGTAAAGKFTYTVTSGNDGLNASVEGDTLTVPAEADTGAYTLTVTVKDKQADNPLLKDKNVPSATLAIRVIVAPAELELTIPAITITYGDPLTNGLLLDSEAKIKDTGITVEGAFTWAVQGVVPTVPDSGVTAYKVVFTPTVDKAENFVEASLARSITVTVNKAPSSGAVEGKTGLAYSGRPQALVEVTEPAVGGAFQYSMAEAGGYSASIPTGTNAGDYTVWYKVVGDENHSDTAPQQLTVAIAKGEGRGAVTMADYTCMDNGVEPVVTSDTNGTENVTYSYKPKGAEDSAYSAEKPLTTGSYTVKAELSENDNFYALTLTADFKITHQFNAGWEQQSDGYRHDCPCGTGLLLEVDALTEVPAGLKDVPEVDSVEKIERVFERQVDTGEDYAVYDVKLEVLVDDEWVEVSPENFPAEGVAVTLPYPDGADSAYTFTVVHMFTTNFGGHVPGQTETLDAANESDGIRFTVMSLSPICVGWKAPPVPTAAPTASGATTSVPPTGDDSRPALWLAVIALSLTGLALIPAMHKKGSRRRGR